MAGTTGLEPATSAVTGQRSNQLSYVPTLSRDNLDLRHLNSAHARKSRLTLSILIVRVQELLRGGIVARSRFEFSRLSRGHVGQRYTSRSTEVHSGQL